MSTSAIGAANAEIGQAGDAIALFADAARHDAGKMRQVRIDIERDAVQRHPLLHADADGGDLVLAAVALVGPAHPDADAVLAPFAAHVEGGERADDPFLQRGDETAHVRAAPLEIEHHVGDPLAGPVIGQLAAAPAVVDRKARLDHVAGFGAGAGGVERRVLQQPDEFGGSCRRRSPAARASMAATASS